MRPIIFCSFQPCPRHANGDLVVGEGPGEKRFPVCSKHMEFVMSQSDRTASLADEIVFADDVPLDILVDNPDRIVVS
jgi:hypothetical protein